MPGRQQLPPPVREKGVQDIGHSVQCEEPHEEEVPACERPRLSLLLHVVLRTERNGLCPVHLSLWRVAGVAAYLAFVCGSNRRDIARSGVKQAPSTAAQIQWSTTDRLYGCHSHGRRLVAHRARYLQTNSAACAYGFARRLRNGTVVPFLADDGLCGLFLNTRCAGYPRRLEQLPRHDHRVSDFTWRAGEGRQGSQ